LNVVAPVRGFKELDDNGTNSINVNTDGLTRDRRLTWNESQLQ
jgi:hypothetical protein